MSDLEICSVPTYKINYNNAKKIIQNIDTISNVLNTDCQFHERLHKEDMLKLAIDIDKLHLHNPNTNLQNILNHICEYVGCEVKDICYTQNQAITTGSYHIVIPKYCMLSKQQKIYWEQFKTQYGYGKEIDNGIFDREGWFRLPNQSKENIKGTEHNIIVGNNKDFILKYTENSTSMYFDKVKQPKNTSVKKIVVNEENSASSDEEKTLVNNKKYNQIKTLISILNPERAKIHQSWFSIACILRNELGNEGLQLFIDWTLKYGTDNKKIECRDKFNKDTKVRANNDKKKLTIATLIQYAKEDNQEEYSKLFPKYLKENDLTEEELLFENCLYNQTEVSIAKYFLFHYKPFHICSSLRNKSFYTFTSNNLWKNDEMGNMIRSKISNEFSEVIKKQKIIIDNILLQIDEDCEEHDNFKKRLALVNELILKLQRTQSKSNIFREICEDILDNDFEKSLNKELNVLPIKNNKMINIATLEVFDRTINNKFTYECDAEYIDLNEEQEKDIDNYFLSLFCNDRETCDSFIDVIKSCLIGKPLKYIFFLTGNGNNGKSCLFKVLNEIFKNAMDTINKDIIVKSKYKSNLTTELVKSDKCRIGYVCELSEKDETNEEMIKKITGGDKIDVRGLFKENETFIPTCNLFALTNEEPTFKASDKAIVDRLIKFPFNNKFERDSSFEDKLLMKKDLIFSYILKKGIIRDKFILSEAMRLAKEELIEDNLNDPLKDFIESRFEIIKYDETENTRVNRDTFRKSFNQYCNEMNYPINKMSNTKFTRIMKQEFKISSDRLGKGNIRYYIGLRYIENEIIEE